jgi:mannosyltransferase
MATTLPPPRRRALPPALDVRPPRSLERLPTWLTMGALLVVLTAFSAYLRTRFISGQFWMDEAITTGIASHPLAQIPGLLREDGSPPLYYLLLHFWIQAFGASEAGTHALSLLFGLLTVPAGMWAGWSLFGRRTGATAAILFAVNAWLTQYAQETRMYELMGLLGLLATAFFIHAFVYRRRGYLVLFAAAEALMLYTHAWAIFFGVGAAVALIPIWRASDDRRGLLRDAVLAFGGAAILFLPWLPNFIYQATHTAAPWAKPPRFGTPILISHDLLGGTGVSVPLLIATIVGVGPFLTRAYRRSRETTLTWTLIVLPVATLAVAWVASQSNPAYVSRYFAPILASILLLAAWGCARSGIIGWVALAVTIVLMLPVGAYTPPEKSDMREVSGELSPLLHPGDLVISAQPEQVPLMWYYLPAGLRYANTLGSVRDPRHFDWVDALRRLQRANPSATLDPLLASLRPGQRLLFVRPITQGAYDWSAPWTQLVRRRSAQWGAILTADPHLKPIAWAPHDYNGAACCVADSAVLYQMK